MSKIRGVIFDLDGTLVDSGLDFSAMRREMQLPADQPLLEAIALMPESRASQCMQILARHEWAGARQATLMPGVRAFVETLHARQVQMAILTRNARDVALATLQRLELPFDLVMAREDAPAKPDPTAIHQAREHWGLTSDEMLMVGDYLFDIEAGRRAGVRTVLFTAGLPAEQVLGHDLADFCLISFEQPETLLAWIDSG